MKYEFEKQEKQLTLNDVPYGYYFKFWENRQPCVRWEKESNGVCEYTDNDSPTIHTKPASAPIHSIIGYVNDYGEWVPWEEPEDDRNVGQLAYGEWFEYLTISYMTTDVYPDCDKRYCAMANGELHIFNIYCTPNKILGKLKEVTE